ncbi:hypothetical protein J437_LFUL013409 [Ladona fulva]|uniref:E3 ubiquitin-protein ligase n=1 Tax=Ladona fulva TaxID=123851 RepID=A0A8K0KGS7_LADFU|nr:hypothetical protein J437_LFUL013409 [Ladona fulva]
MDKWKRIIEPAGDSESSDWSSEDSTASCAIAPIRFRQLQYSSKERPQGSSSSTQNQVDPVEDCWQEYPSEYRSQPRKRRLSRVAQVNVSCSTSVVTRDAENEESMNVEGDKDGSELYGSGSRSWGMRNESAFPFQSFRKLSRFTQKFFNGASTSYQTQETSDHTASASINPASPSPVLSTSKTCSSQKKMKRFNPSENEEQLNHELEENDNTEILTDDNVICNRVADTNNDESKADSNENSKDTLVEGNSAVVTAEDSDLQQDMVELPNMDLNQSLISLLECPVCLEYVFPPINQCKRGHLVCANCKPQLNNCPSCRSRFTETRNLAMEKVAEKLYYPCRNHTSGCKGMYLLQDKREHEANCHFRTYKCIVSHCLWKGFRPDILGHMVDAHKKIVVYGESQVLCIKLDTCVHFTQNWIVSAFGQVFRVNFLVSYLRSQIAGCVQYLGPRKHASSYCYTFDVCSNNRRLLYSRQTHGDTGRLMTLYNTGDCFHLRTDAANYYVKDRVIKVKLNIKKASDVPEQ